MFSRGEETGRYSVHTYDEVIGGDEQIRTSDLPVAESIFNHHRGARYIQEVRLIDLHTDSVLQSWSADPQRTPDSALARCPE